MVLEASGRENRTRNGQPYHVAEVRRGKSH